MTTGAVLLGATARRVRTLVFALVVVSPAISPAVLATATPAQSPETAPAAPPGSRLWLARLQVPAKDTSANALAVSPDGAVVFVTGGSIEFVTAAYRVVDGRLLWHAEYGGPAGGADLATAIGVSPDGSKVFVTGYSFDLDTNDDYATVAYDARTGAELWVARYDSIQEPDYANALAISPNGSLLFVTGGSDGVNGDQDIATVAYDAETGAQLWVDRYDGPANGFDFGWAIVASVAGDRVLVAGQSGSVNADDDAVTIALDATTGARLWLSRYNGPTSSYDVATAIARSADGARVYVEGNSNAGVHGQDYLTISYDAATGAQVWASLYDGTGHSTDVGYDIQPSADGHLVFVTGGSRDVNLIGQFATVAYDSGTGAQVWAARYSPPGSPINSARRIAVDPTGSTLAVTGVTGASYDYLTLSYTTSGTLRWAAKYSGVPRGYDDPTAIGMTRNGELVFVTGVTEGRNGQSFCTIAYRV